MFVKQFLLNQKLNFKLNLIHSNPIELIFNQDLIQI